MGGGLGVGGRRREPIPMIPLQFSIPGEVTYPVRRSRKIRRKGKPKKGRQFLVPTIPVAIIIEDRQRPCEESEEAQSVTA